MGPHKSQHFEPSMEDFIESSWELVLGRLGFDMFIPNIIGPSLRAFMNSMCHI
jgi:hypothetical protein